MLMKKNVIRFRIILLIILIVYNVAVFAMPFQKTPIFFLSWIFTLVAIGAQAYVGQISFFRGSGIKSKFYGFPLARIGALYLIVQMILGFVFLIPGNRMPFWIPLVSYSVILGVFAIGLIAADAARDDVERQDEAQRQETGRIRSLQSKAASLASLTQDGQIRSSLEKLAENLRFSDPVSSEALAGIESDLAACIDDLQQAVLDEDRESVLVLVQKAQAVLAERNRRCKAGKQSR